MKKPVAAERFELGVCYYPEHWPESMWADDYRRMVETGFTIVRLAEFAWSIFLNRKKAYFNTICLTVRSTWHTATG
ncbi:beta-galactosidase [Paenibacillus rhizoplanae]